MAGQRRRRMHLRRKGWPLVIAFAGVPSVHKGWLEFCDLAAAARAGAPATFLYLGSSAIDAAGVDAVSVQVSGDDHDAMIAPYASSRSTCCCALACGSGDLLRFTTHEALAGGALVITNADSGNVAATVRQAGRGLVLETPRDLLDALRDGRLRAFVDGFRRERPYETVLVERSRA